MSMKFKQRTMLRPATATEQAYLRRMLSINARIGRMSLSRPDKRASRGTPRRSRRLGGWGEIRRNDHV